MASAAEGRWAELVEMWKLGLEHRRFQEDSDGDHSMNLDALRVYRTRIDAERESLFQDWPVDPAVREACRTNFVRTLDALIALGPEASQEAAREVLRHCVERFNELDEADAPFICTIEREELCEMLYEIGDLCGIDSGDDWVDDWRDW